ncbi:hypothetical protein HDU76_013520 [Blyttiomyces sp. JEL0837]|nr:hypothetical protein HDU76_013520 [Blyttiomyces sp. JEL0837]
MTGNHTEPNNVAMAGVFAPEREAENERDGEASSSATRTLVNGAQHVVDVSNVEASNGPLRVSVGEPAEEEVSALDDDQAMHQGDGIDIDGGNGPDIAVPPLIRPVAVRATGVTFPSFAATLQPINVGLPLPVQDVQSPFNHRNAAPLPAFGGVCQFPVATHGFDLAGQGSFSQAFPLVPRAPPGRQVHFPGVRPGREALAGSSSVLMSLTSVIDRTTAGQSRAGSSVAHAAISNSQEVADWLAQEAVVRQQAFLAAATVQMTTSTSNDHHHVQPHQQQVQQQSYQSIASTNAGPTQTGVSAANAAALYQPAAFSFPINNNFLHSNVYDGGRVTPANMAPLPLRLLHNVYKPERPRE